jgi:hypothetical protein
MRLRDLGARGPTPMVKPHRQHPRGLSTSNVNIEAIPYKGSFLGLSSRPTQSELEYAGIWFLIPDRAAEHPVREVRLELQVGNLRLLVPLLSIADDPERVSRGESVDSFTNVGEELKRLVIGL